MPAFTPYTSPPPEGTTIETEVFDAKATLDSTERGRFKLAKHVAAFANRYGGCILVGGEEVGGRLKYAPQPKDVIAKIHTAFSEAVRDRCSPKPFVGCVVHDTPGGSMLLANVDPFIGQLVGVSVKGDKNDGHGGDAYVFPIRVGKDASYLLPEQFPMYSDPQIRRVVILLRRIPKGEKVLIHYHEDQNPKERLFVEVREEHNVFVCDTQEVFPLDLVRSVHAGPGAWRIILENHCSWEISTIAARRR